jgi:hypothetical protein
LGEFDQFIQPFEHGMMQEKPDITSKLQIMGSLCDNANILMHLQDQGTVF